MKVSKQMTGNQSGFTLIELLVVIAIIGLLSSTVLVSAQTVRERAAVQGFVSNLESLRDALEGYHTDHGEYPHEVFGSVGNGFIGTGSLGDFQVLVDKGYLNSLPEVPNYFPDGYYAYYSNWDAGLQYYQCGGRDISSTNQDYLLVASDKAGAYPQGVMNPDFLPDTIPRLTYIGTLYETNACFSTSE